MSEKEKPKRSTRTGFLRSCLIFSLYPLIILTVLGIGLAYWAFGGYVKSSLDPQYIPTAEYLLENQIKRETSIHLLEDGDLELYASLDVNLTTSNEICLTVISMDDEDFDYLYLAELYINEQVVSRFRYEVEGVALSLPAFSDFCFNGHLDSGLHIIEFRAKESLFAEPYYIQRWAIEIP
jgi:hypothetical protein